MSGNLELGSSDTRKCRLHLKIFKDIQILGSRSITSRTKNQMEKKIENPIENYRMVFWDLGFEALRSLFGVGTYDTDHSILQCILGAPFLRKLPNLH